MRKIVLVAAIAIVAAAVASFTPLGRFKSLAPMLPSISPSEITQGARDLPIAPYADTF
jgi:hypothetical protein